MASRNTATAAAAAATVLVLVALAVSAAGAGDTKFNITEILGGFPEFSTFNGLLSRMNLSEEINRRQTITVLVVDSSAAAAITSLPADAQRNVLAVHVLLDYYDPVKLDGIEKRTAHLTTLLQATGVATGLMGFVKYCAGADDQMAFGSAEPGAPISSQLVKLVACQPYSISVMQVSTPILPPRIRLSVDRNGGGGAAGPAEAGDPSPAAAPSSDILTIEAEAPEPSDDGSADPDVKTPSSAAVDELAAEDAPATSPPVKSAETTAVDAPPSSTGNAVLVLGSNVGLIGLVMFIM